MRKIYILFICVLIAYSCTPFLEPQRKSVALMVSSGDILIESESKTKAQAVPFNGNPTENNPLNVALWLSFQAGKYSHNPSVYQNLPCATTLSFTNTSNTDVRCNGKLILYPIAADENFGGNVGNEVYCVGFYPSSGWGEMTSNEVTTAQHDINGSEDIMFSDQMVGSYSKNFGTQRYNHLLTWVKVNMKATSLETAEYWGDVEQLKVVSPKNKVKIDFSSTLNNDKPEASTISYIGESEAFQLDLPQDKSLSITTRTFGQVFCAPPVEKDNKYGYKIKVKTKNLTEKEIFVELKKEDNVNPIDKSDYAVGKLVVITLHFNEIGVVEGVCTLRQWDDQNSEIYLNDGQI